MIRQSTRLVLVAAIGIGIVAPGCQHMKEVGAGVGAVGGGLIGYGIAKSAGADDKTAIAIGLASAAAGGVIGWQVGKYLEKRQAAKEEKSEAERQYRQRNDRRESDEVVKKQTESLASYTAPADSNLKKAVATEVKPNTWVMVDPNTGVAGDDAYVLSDSDSEALRNSGKEGKLAQVDNYTVAVSTQ